MKRKTQKLVWAANPFMFATKEFAKIAGLAKSLGPDTQVQPVFVVSPAEFAVTFDSGTLQPERLKEIAINKLISVMGSKARANFLAPEVVYEKAFKISGSAKALVAHASTSNATAIVVQTRGQGHVGAFGMGSFAQALLFEAKLPVITLNPQVQVKPKLKSILFVTDFSNESRLAFTKLCETFVALGTKIEIAHYIPKPVSWLKHPLRAAEAALPPFDTQDYLKQARSFAKNDVKDFLQIAAHKKVNASFEIIESKFPPAQAFCAHAKKRKHGMIAMTAVSGRFLGNLLGTLTHKVVSRSSVPVWVLQT